MAQAERELAHQAEPAYKNTVHDWAASAPAKVGASATPGHASQGPSKGHVARQTTSPLRLHFDSSVTRPHNNSATTEPQRQHDLTFIRRALVQRRWGQLSVHGLSRDNRHPVRSNK
jgi:hypothetical protein